MTAELAAREPTSRQRQSPGRTQLMVARIAIADDDPESLELLSASLQSPTTEICTAASGAELVVLLAEHGPFDLIVTDVDMPWMEGLAVIRTARASEIQAPVLVITGLSRPDLEASVARLGNASLLRKPIGISDLRSAVAELLTGRV
jgi:two-component system cell cycle response regulator CpdR